MESSIDMAYVTFLLFLVVVERRVTGVKTIKTLVKQQELITKQAEKAFYCFIVIRLILSGTHKLS